jgi:CRISPR/Cas system CMR subunit Cmr6 (Cas7 group RAMP superfamily)
MVHMTVIDTSLVFPHYYGMPFRRSLKSIVHSYLNSEIQAENSGHDSYEDARACVELMLWKVRQDYNTTSSSSSTLTDQQPPPAASSSTRGGQQGNGASSFQYSPFPPPQQQQPPEQ